MDDAWVLAGDGATEGVVVMAREQTAGRGRYERSWRSNPGEDLLFSALFRPRPAIAPEVNMLLALAVAETVEEECGAGTAIKWPNDVRVDGAKVAGVLLESRQGASGIAVVAGVGLNVNSSMAGEQVDGVRAVSMRDISGRRFDIDALLVRVLERIDGHYAAVCSGRTVVPAWRERLETIGGAVTVRFRHSGAGSAAGRTRDEEELASAISGVAEAVDQAGRLLVRDDYGRLWPVSAGEVTLRSGEG